jgi:hypothetical protein
LLYPRQLPQCSEEQVVYSIKSIELFLGNTRYEHEEEQIQN